MARSRLAVLDNFDTQVLTDEETGVLVTPGSQPVLGIERLDDVAGRFAFSVDGRRVGPEVECKSLRNFRNPFGPVRLGRGRRPASRGRHHPLRARDPGPVSAARRAAGFTLLEIMVVIALIGLLLGLVAVAVGRQTEAGRIAECRARIEQFALLLESSKDRNGDYPPDRLAALGVRDGNTINEGIEAAVVALARRQLRRQAPRGALAGQRRR